MKKELLALAAASSLAFSATAAFAQSTGGSAADPNTPQNQVPAPSIDNPSDPAAGSSPGARVPTSPEAQEDLSGSGAAGTGSGEMGTGSDAERSLQKPQSSDPSP